VRTLGAILLNPPLTGGSATTRHLQVAAEVLGCDGAQIANLFAIPTRSVVEINDAGRLWAGWEAARPELERVIASADELLAGWGVSGLHGEAADNLLRQVTWVGERVEQAVRRPFWMLNGEPRHPSRWHQYVSDRHGRASGDTFRQRLASVLRPIGSAEYVGAPVAEPLPQRASFGGLGSLP
jgi:hypothetical protein